jgi:hypothetical protein
VGCSTVAFICDWPTPLVSYPTYQNLLEPAQELLPLEYCIHHLRDNIIGASDIERGSDLDLKDKLAGVYHHLESNMANLITNLVNYSAGVPVLIFKFKQQLSIALFTVAKVQKTKLRCAQYTL